MAQNSCLDLVLLVDLKTWGHRCDFIQSYFLGLFSQALEQWKEFHEREDGESYRDCLCSMLTPMYHYLSHDEGHVPERKDFVWRWHEDFRSLDSRRGFCLLCFVFPTPSLIVTFLWFINFQ